MQQALDCNKEINLFKCACVSVEDIDDVVSDMKRGKACDIDGLSVEHIQYAHPSIVFLLKKLFNCCLRTGAIPARFGLSLLVHIPKNGSYKDRMSFEDFRGISVSSIISKIFEHLISRLVDEKLQNSDCQLGFKKNSGCSHVIF